MSGRDFVGIYEENVSQVYGFFAYMLGSCLDAEDLTQQTFERALRSWERYDNTRGSGSAWLLTIARNLLIDHLRANIHGRTAPIDELDLDAIAAVPDHHSLGLDPDLELAMSQLAPRVRELIALRFGGDLSCAEIATLTGLSLANVQQMLSRSLRRLRATLDGDIAAHRQRVGVG